MQGVRLAVGIADAIPRSEPADETADAPARSGTAPAEARPAVAPPPPEPEPPRRRRGGIAGWLRRPAEYVRAYLTASVSHQQQLLASRTAEIQARVSAIESLDGRLAELLVETRSVSLRLDDIERRQLAQTGRLEGIERRQAAFDGLQSQLAEVGHRVGNLQNIGADLLTVGDRNSRLGIRAVEQLDVAIGVLGPRFDELDRAVSFIGPRFDELDIKVRPLVPFDEESWAVRVADGYLMTPRSEPVFTVMVANASSGGLEPGVRRVLQALLRPGMRAADVGANVGLLTLAMAVAVGSSGRVRAFEPEARARRQLAKTLHLNGLRQVQLSDAAVGAEPGRLTFHESPVIGHSSLYDLPEDERGGERAVQVEVVRLDDAVPPGEPLDVVKIDVEGAELDVVRGMGRLLEENADIAVLAEYGPSHLRRVGIAPADWFGAFAAHGLEPHLIGEPDGVARPTDAEALAGVESANLVFVRPGGAAEARLPR